MYSFDNYSHEYNTRRILDLDKILLLPSCTNVVEKIQFSLFLISCSQVILSSSYSPGIFPKDCFLHVSFTAYENFYKLSKMHCLLVLTSHFPIFRMSKCRNPTVKHIFTYTLISPFISTYVTDLFLVIFFT